MAAVEAGVAVAIAGCELVVRPSCLWVRGEEWVRRCVRSRAGCVQWKSKTEVETPRSPKRGEIGAEDQRTASSETTIGRRDGSKYGAWLEDILDEIRR